MDITTIINDFLKKNNYTLLFHSTSNYDTAKMILEEGLLKGDSHYYEDRRKVLDEIEIPNPHLEQLVRQSTKTGRYSTIKHYYRLKEEYEKDLPRRDTVSGVSELEPKKLKEYNHKDGTGTVVLCVPKYKYDHATANVDRYLRATVSYGIDEDDIINQFQVLIMLYTLKKRRFYNILAQCTFLEEINREVWGFFGIS